MRSPFALLRRQSLRLRITVTFVAAAAILSAILSTAAYFAVRSFLEDQRIRSSTRQTVFGLLFAHEFLRDEPSGAEDIVTLLQTRGGFEVMVAARDDWYASTLSLTPAAVPGGLATLVAEERFGYQLTDLDGTRFVAFGAPLPVPETDLFMFYSLGDIDQTMSVLGRVLAIAGLGIVSIAALLAQRTTTRLLRPLGDVSAAAQRVAEGLLETRVRASSDDEVGVLAASFNQMAAAFQEMIQRERRFVANVSHELRTPLAALRTASDIIGAHRDELGPSGREAIDLIREDVASLQRLVEDLMEVSEVDSGAARIRWEVVDLRALVAAVADKRRREARIDGDAVTTVTDKSRLERIVANLLDNAYEHGRGRDVRVAIRAADGWCAVSVSDAGPGIAPADLPHLFDRFYKADRARSREHGGIGLGLAIAGENARLLGGAIDVESAGGRTVFTVRLPYRSDPPGEAGT